MVSQQSDVSSDFCVRFSGHSNSILNLSRNAFGICIYPWRRYMKKFYFRDALTVTFESFPIDVLMACINKGDFLFFYYVAHN